MFSFGVCCVILETSGASATVSQNRTYLRNANYPSVTTETAATTIAYTVQKCRTGMYHETVSNTIPF